MHDKNMTYLLFLLFLISLVKSNAKSASPEVHAFFYLWYGEPKIDKEYKHWNHEVLPHWTPHINAQFPDVGKKFTPPEQLHSPYYPLYGPYSSRDPKIVKKQIDDMVRAGITCAVLSWWGQAGKPYATDTQGVNTDKVLAELFQIFEDDGSRVKIAIHMEPYPGRSITSVRDDIEYLITKYARFSSLHRGPDGRPFLYVYDSYHILSGAWGNLLHPQRELSIRNTQFDAVVIGLFLDNQHGRDMLDAGFDGFYTYFATDGFSHGSSSTNWRNMCRFARSHRMLCILSVGPGYNDTKIRPWNAHNARGREGGRYYADMFRKAIEAASDIISITSYNEWGEGTQIEPAVSKEVDGRPYDDYSVDDDEDAGPYHYIELTRNLTNIFAAAWRERNDEDEDL